LRSSLIPKAAGSFIMFPFVPFYARSALNFVSNLFVAVVGGGGGTVDTAPSLAATSSAPPTPVTAISGRTDDLGRNVTAFSSTVAMPSNFKDIIDLTNTIGVATLTANRLSAELVGDLSVSAVIEPKDDASFIFFSGLVAIRGQQSGLEIPSAFKNIGNFPGSCIVTVTAQGSTPGILQLPTGVRRELLISQVIGRPPAILYQFNSVGVKKAYLKIEGTLALAGMGEPIFSF
jgi:hypothetical protein